MVVPGDVRERYARLESMWNEAAKAFARIHMPEPTACVGTKVFVYDAWDRHDVQGEYCLLVRREGSRRSFEYGIQWDYMPDEVQFNQIAKAPMWLRVKLAGYLPQLRDAVLATHEGFGDQVDDAIASLEHFVAGLNRS